MMSGNAEISVPPGFRFHPTDEELLYYYLRKKVSYEAIDLDVIREVDLNKLEPWDLKDKCRIGSGPHNEWYFFSHKDKKYPTGTRTNRATTAGFWKATGRDKAIHHTNSKRIGMRKTLVFYTGRAPHGQKTDWIMHEYRLEDENSRSDIQEDGWVVCRVFKKKNHNTITRGFQQDVSDHHHHHHHQEADEHLFDHDHHHHHMVIKESGSAAPLLSVLDLHYSKQNHFHHQDHHHNQYAHYTCLDPGAMHLPQLFSPESAAPPPPAGVSLNPMELECSQNLLRLTSGEHNRFHGDWSFLDKLLTSGGQAQHIVHDHDQAGTSTQNKLSFQYLGCESDVLKFPK